MKVSLPRGIASISGTVSRRPDGCKLIAKTYHKADGSKETRMYWMPKFQRSTPVSDNERAVRTRFTEATRFYQQLTTGQKMQYAEAFKKDRYRFNGKEYVTLRGYIIARFYRNALL